MFKFKQFEVDQQGCAMKINTDGVLLGAFVTAHEPQHIIDIGTGTGVIALMLAQKFADARIDSVEIDHTAAATAKRNFENSVFGNRLCAYESDIAAYFAVYLEKKYDLIVSNPPFYINSLEASRMQMNVAKHTDGQFFGQLIANVAAHLSPVGKCWLVLPLPTAALVKELVTINGLFLQKTIAIHSFQDSAPHREIIVIGLTAQQNTTEKFIIYDAPKVYSKEYQHKLKDFFIVF